MKILITGGHVTPALAIIDELKNQEIVFVGRKYALETEQSLSLEYKEITSRKINFINLTSGRITRLLSAKTFFSLLRIPIGFVQAFSVIKNESPDIVLAFGSYLSVPIVFWAAIFGIHIFIHEQSITPGIANKITSLFAKKVFISFEQARPYFPQNKVVLTGNPIRKSILKTFQKPFEIKNYGQAIFVTGGSLGSHSINEHIKALLKELLENFVVIHQVGDIKEHNDFQILTKLRDSLTPRLKEKYFIKQHFLENEIGYVYSVSDIVVGRAGANTFFELLTLQKPAILIPLPWSANNEQLKQAQLFQQAGVGEVFNQTDSSEQLLNLIKKMLKNVDSYRNNFKNLQSLYKSNAAEIITKTILKK